ncbi:hypothetical protein [Alicyclobacillus macrosporangiidus]
MDKALKFYENLLGQSATLRFKIQV